MTRRITFLLITTLLVLIPISLAFMVPSPARADGAIQISGIGYFDVDGECIDSEGEGADFVILMTGDLEGCRYVFVETFEDSPSGTYRERGTEILVVKYGGKTGTFETTYHFTGKFEDVASWSGEQFGNCHHPIVEGSGTGDFEGVTGRLDFRDNVEDGIAVNYPYRGHLEW